MTWILLAIIMISPLQKFKLFKYWQYKPSPKQFEAHISDSKFILVRGGNRSGKTMLAGMESSCEMQCPNQNIWNVAPTYDLADKVFRLTHKFGVESIGTGWSTLKDKSIPQEVIIGNNSHCWAKSTENLKQLEGEGVDLMTVDEFGFMNKLIINRLLMRLDRPNSRGVFILTPKGKNLEIRDFWNRKMNDPAWHCIEMPTDEQPHVSKEFLEMADRELGGKHAPAYREQIRGEFVAYGLLVYPMFTKKNIGRMQTYKSWKYIIGADSGFIHPCHASFIGISPQDDVYKVGEYHRHYMTRRENAKGIKDKAVEILKRHKSIEQWHEIRYDPSDPAFAKELKKAFSKLGTRVLPANNDVEGRIELTRRLLDGRYKIDPSCKNTIFSYQNYAHKKDSETVQKINDDPCDADGYALLSHYGKPKGIADYVFH